MRKNKSNYSRISKTRVVLNNANPVALLKKFTQRPIVDDRRIFTPDRTKKNRYIQNSNYKLKETGSHLRPKLSFQDPLRLQVCIRRKTRRQVMFAKKKAGKAGQRKPRYNYYSSIKC